MKGLLRQLSELFPGEFRSIADPTFYSREDTTVVQATHIVSALLERACCLPRRSRANGVGTMLYCHMQAAGQVIIKITHTKDTKLYARAKRELFLYKKFHKAKRICNLINGTTRNAAPGLAFTCACVLEFFELGTVQSILDAGNPMFVERLKGFSSPILRFKYAVAMGKDVLDGLECMHKMHIVHRDIKPANICVELVPGTDHLRYTIIDLGSAVSTLVQDSDDDTDTESGHFAQFTSVAGLKLPLGTVPFMSPEHLDPDRHVRCALPLTLALSLALTPSPGQVRRRPIRHLQPRSLDVQVHVRPLPVHPAASPVRR